MEVMRAYCGGLDPFCACCGERGFEFLTIDHTHNDGAQHRREIGKGRSSASVLGWLKRNGYPTGFQVLCWNCNCAKAHHGGVCPHKKAEP